MAKSITCLEDLGERQILRSLVRPIVQAAGDDCAHISFPGKQLVVTTDPVPPPAAFSLGRDHDYFWMGWLLATINASDLAASGAFPLGFVAAIEVEPSFRASEFTRLLKGIKSSCKRQGLAYVGGNIRESKLVSAVGTAFGYHNGSEALSREGISPASLIVSIGRGGVFWRDALMMKSRIRTPMKMRSPLFAPISQIRAMALLNSKGMVEASMDNSDGLLPTLETLALESRVRIELDLGRLSVPGISGTFPVDPARLWLGWGDWNVIVSVLPEKASRLERILRSARCYYKIIGRAENSRTPEVVLIRNGRRLPAPRLESERFAKDSWMRHRRGIDRYIDDLLSSKLP